MLLLTEDLRMSEKINIASRLKDYSVEFLQDPFEHMMSTLDENAVLVIDEKIFDLYKERLTPIVKSYRTVFITCTESNKTMDYCQVVIRKLLEHKIRKNDTLVAVGGGITQDIVAFISSIIFRGIAWNFYPTTLLAQADSCIGSKSSINFDSYKNLLGTFTPPSRIFISITFLHSLSDSEVRSGIGEMLHYFLNDGMEDATLLMSQFDMLLKERDNILPFIRKSLLIKKKIIEIDEFDTSTRHIFNYGHTFGHAIEAVTNYAIPHGQAITLGMDIANYLSWKLNMIDEKVFNEMHTLLQKNIPEYKITPENIDVYITALSKDKKNVAAKLGCILTDGPGKMRKCFLDMDDWFKQQLLQYSLR